MDHEISVYYIEYQLINSTQTVKRIFFWYSKNIQCGVLLINFKEQAENPLLKRVGKQKKY